MAKRYINIASKDGNPAETVDEFQYDTPQEIEEFNRVLSEYQKSDTYNRYYTARVATKEWRNKA